MKLTVLSTRTRLRRARRLERAIGTGSRLYYKDESGNVAGSHKYLTALAQVHYYAEDGLGSTVALINQDRLHTADYDYDPTGEVTDLEAGS